MHDNNELFEVLKLTKNNEKIQFLQTLIETIPNAIFYKDSNFIYRYCNNAFLKFIGLEREEVIDHSVYDISPKELADIYNKADYELFKSNSNQIYESKVVYKDGTPHDVIFNKAVVINNENKAIGIVGVIVDITERKRDEMKIQRLLKIKEAMLQVNQSIMEIHDINMLFKLILEKVMQSMELSYVGQAAILDDNENFNTITWKVSDREIEKECSFGLKETLIWKETGGNISKSFIINDINKDGNIKVIDKLNSSLKHKVRSSIYSPIIIENKLYGIISIYSKDVNSFDEIDLEIMDYMKNQVEIAINNHRMYEKIIYLSRHDKLTDLYNRAYFEDLFHRCLKEYVENKKEFFVVAFDLNGLKPINDIYGHFVGDEFIKMFTKNIKNIVEPGDIVGRIGGDEFSAICFEKDIQSLIKKFEDLLEYFKTNQLIFKEDKIICSFSYGIAKFPSEGTDYNTLMKLADNRMYDYKQEFKRKQANTSK
jgi:PAS domain S-box/diguanylate cyclase (GGDEF) domain